MAAADMDSTRGSEIKQKEKTQRRREEGGGKAAQKRKGPSPTSSTKVKGQKSWKAISPSTIAVVENIMDRALISTLSLSQNERTESKKHLGIIKNRFLGECRELKAPGQKLKGTDGSYHRQQEETKKCAMGKATLSGLQEDLKSVISALENGEEQMISVQQSCRSLRDQIEEEEDKLKEHLQYRNKAVLNLRPLPPPQGEMEADTLIRTVPERERQATAQRLGDFLLRSEPISNVQLLLLQAHKHNDQL